MTYEEMTNKVKHGELLNNPIKKYFYETEFKANGSLEKWQEIANAEYIMNYIIDKFTEMSVVNNNLHNLYQKAIDRSKGNVVETLNFLIKSSSKIKSYVETLEV